MILLKKFKVSPLFLSLLSIASFSSLTTLLIASNSANAALTAVTANTIHGTAPYLSFDGGTTKATDLASLLSIQLSNGTTYDTTHPTATVITLPNANETFNDITASITANNTAVGLTTLIASKMYDDDDDSNVATNTATGTIKATWKDSDGNIVADGSAEDANLNDKLTVCDAPYTLTLEASPTDISTQYGDPKTTVVTTVTASHTYTIKPQGTIPPVVVSLVAPNPTENYSHPSHPEWVGNGFKLQDVCKASKNFPRTGFNGAFFDLTFTSGITAQSVIDEMGGTTVGSGNVTLTLSKPGAANVLRVKLNGPTAMSSSAFNATKFTLRSGGAIVYRFELSKWFITKNNDGGGYTATQTFCSGLAGGGKYRVPSVGEYTNSTASGWTGGLPGNGNRYARAIGDGKTPSSYPPRPSEDGKGGLFAEWGWIDNATYYTDSDFVRSRYWAAEPYSASQQYAVHTPDGVINAQASSFVLYKAACVSY